MSSAMGPRRSWYAFAVALALVGGCGVVGAGMWHAYDKVTHMPRGVMPGDLELTLDSGSYTIFWEPRSVVDNQAFVSQQASVRCQLASADGHQAKLSSSGASVSYSMGSYKGQSLFDADVDQAGKYTLSCASDDGAKVVLAVGQGLGTTIVLTIVGGIVGFGAGVAIFLVVYYRRRKARQRASVPEARIVS